MCKKQLIRRHLPRIFALVSVIIMVASLMVPLSAGLVPLCLSTDIALAQGSTMPMVTAGTWFTVGLRSDGTVVAVGSNDGGQCDVSSWTNITQVSAGRYHTVGLRSDGTVVAVGDNYQGQCNVSSWTGIMQVAAGGVAYCGPQVRRHRCGCGR
jgi:hypothetical protein